MDKKVKSRQALYLGYVVVVTIILAFFIACMGSSLKARAVTESHRSKKVVSVVCVKEGDTLWSIAADFYTEDYRDINELVKEIAKCNGISEHIRIGQNLYIPHYKQI